MSLSAKGGQLTTPASTGNQAVTGVGFQPKLVLLWGPLATDTSASTIAYGVGTSSSARWCVNNDRENGGLLRRMNTNCIYQYSSITGPTVLLQSDLVSLDADGFTINWSVTVNGFPVNYLCLGGADLSVKVGVFGTGTSSGSVAVTGVGFQPGGVMLASCFTVTGVNAVDSSAYGSSLGFATSSSARLTVSTLETGTSTTAAGSMLDTGHIFSLLSAKTTVYSDADFTSCDADGFTINMTTAAGVSLELGYVAFGGVAQYAVGTFAQPGSTGPQAITSPGFPPTAELFVSAGKTSNASPTVHARQLLAAAVNSSDRRETWTTVKDATAQGSTPWSRLISASHVATFTGDDNNTAAAEADFTSQDATGFTWNWTTADATARVIGAFTMGAAPVVASPSFKIGTINVGHRPWPFAPGVQR